MESVIVHVDKSEFFFPNTAQNAEVLSMCFHDLTRLWTSRWNLQWQDLPKKYDLQNRWRLWKIKGISDRIGIFIQGPAYHLNETTQTTRLFHECEWMSGRPFPGSAQRAIYHQHPHLGLVRLTDKQKSEPYEYSHAVFSLLRDIEDFGAEDFPRKLEIALDCRDEIVARDLRLTLRLRRSNPRSLVHFLPGLQGHVFRGPGMGGDREYQTYFAYVTDGVRQLAFYPRWESGFYRIELRLGKRAVRRYIRSQEFQRVRDAAILSPTLAAMTTMQTVIEKNIIRERLDVAALHSAHPSTRGLGLEHLSIRGQRYRLVQTGFSLDEINRYAQRLAMPPMTILTPS